MKHFLRFTVCCLLAASAAFVTSCKEDDPKPDNGDGPGEAISVAARHALGLRTEAASADSPSSFRIVMSESGLTGTADAPQFAAAGKYVTITLHAIESDKFVLPAGTYPLVEGKPADGEGDLAASRFGTSDAQGTGGGTESLLSGSVTVTHTATGYKVELSAELAEKRTLTCVYEGAIDFGKEEEDPGPSYDLVLNAKFALGELYSAVGEDGSSDFYVIMSDVEMEGEADDPSPVGAGQFVMLDFCAIEREEGILPEGTYLFTLDEPADMKGMLDFSGYATTDESGEPTSEEPIYFSACTATVSYTDDGYKIEAIATLEDGRTLHCIYEGMIEFVPGGGSGDITLPGLEDNVETTFILAEGDYLGTSSDGTAQYTISFWDNDLNQNYRTTNRITLALIGPDSQTPLQLTPGQYTVSDSGAAGTLYPGSLDLATFQIIGSYCEQALVVNADYSLLYGMLVGGTVDIATSGNGYTVTADLIDADGNTIKGTYSGQIEIGNNSFYSTLEGDKQADVAGMPCELVYYADYFGVRGDNWSVFIGTEADGTEAFQIELIAPMGDYGDGLPAGEYIVTDLDSYPSSAGKTCVPGVYSGGYLYNSWYLGDYQDGYVFSMAPFTSGKVTVERSGNQYTIGVDIYDDAQDPHRVTSTWTGIPTIKNESGAQPAPQIYSRKRASAKTATKSAAERDHIAAHAVKVQPSAPKSPRW